MTTILLPGDPLPSTNPSATLHLGPGFSSTPDDKVTATRAGLVGQVTGQDKQGTPSEKWWIEGKARRYIPQPPEPVLGIIIARHAEGYRVDIGSSQAASLDALAFEGATKRNKPNLKVGTLIYAHLLPTPPFAEPELSCVDASTQKAAGFGELAGGFLIRGVELGRCRALLSPSDRTLPRLGASFPFEVAVGMNGRVWVKCGEGDEEKLVGVIKELKGR